MKKLFFIALAMIASMVVNAQELNLKDVIAQSEKNKAKLQEYVDTYGSTTTGNPDVDRFGKSILEAAKSAITNSDTLKSFYYREIGETVDGVTDVTVHKPSLEQWAALSEGVAKETVYVTDATKGAEDAAKAVTKMSDDVKNAKGKDKITATKNLKNVTKFVDESKSALSVLTVESANQTKSIGQIISTLKSGKNL